MTSQNHFLRFLPVAALFAISLGCLPEGKAPTIEGTVPTNKAAQLQSKIRSQNDATFTVDHEVDGKPFKANWEISNALAKKSKLQLKPPADWSLGDVYSALDVVMQAHQTKPWYGQIDETVFRLFQEASKDKEGFARDYAPESPYEVGVKVKQHSSEWMVEVKVQILDEDGTAIGF